jgi:hypothetical protein
MGLTECVKNDLLQPYPVLSEKKGDIVAQFKWTIAVRENGPFVIAGLTLDESNLSSENKITDENILNLLNIALDTYLPNSKKTTKVEKKKVDSKEKREKKKQAKAKRQEELKKKREEEEKAHK